MFAQTFAALGPQSTSLTIFLLNNVGDLYPDAFDFTLLITDPAIAGSSPAGTILFQSEAISVAATFPNVLQAVTFDLSGLSFEVGHQYAWVVETVSTRDGIAGVGQTFIGRHDPYAGGKFFTSAYDSLYETWNSFSLFDAAFILEFTKPISDGQDTIIGFDFLQDVIEIHNADPNNVIVQDVTSGTKVITPNEGSILLDGVHILPNGGSVLASDASFSWLLFN